MSDPALVPSALAAGLGVSSDTEDPTSNVVLFLRDRAMLLVLDSCETLLPAVATLAEAILKGAPRTDLLATSREPIRGEGEWLHRLGSLGVPPATEALTAEEALSYPAIRLFAERVAACIDGFTLTDADAPLVADICRRLDGIALAIGSLPAAPTPSESAGFLRS